MNTRCKHTIEVPDKEKGHTFYHKMHECQKHLDYMSIRHFPYKYVPVYEPNPTPICLSCPISAGFKSTQNSLNPQNKILALNLLCGQLNVWRLKTHLFLTHSTAVNSIRTKCKTKLFPSMRNVKERKNYQSMICPLSKCPTPVAEFKPSIIPDAMLCREPIREST